METPKQHLAVSPEEQRVAPRVTLLIRPAKLATPEGEFVCVIRDVSATGVSVRLFHPLPHGKAASLETETGQRLAMRRVWVRGSEAGFQFEHAIDVASLISEAGQFPKRKLRIEIELPVTVTILGTDFQASVSDLSQQGARIELNAPLALAQRLLIRSDYLPDIRAQVRWRGGGGYGLVFEDTFSLGDFANIAALLQSPTLLHR